MSDNLIGGICLLACATVVALVWIVNVEAPKREGPRHVHQWTSVSRRTVHHYSGNADGSRSDLPTSRTTYVGGICGDCGEPLMEEFDGIWDASDYATDDGGASGAREGGTA